PCVRRRNRGGVPWRRAYGCFNWKEHQGHVHHRSSPCRSGAQTKLASCAPSSPCARDRRDHHHFRQSEQLLLEAARAGNNHARARRFDARQSSAGRQGRLVLRIAHFIQRYPPALGGSEAYFARLSGFCTAGGDKVTVFTTNALALEAFWSRQGACLPDGESIEAGVSVRRYRLWRFPGRRYLLKPLSLIPLRMWQCLTLPCNPIAPAMWRDAGWLGARFDVVHAAALPYAFPIVCARRLARRLSVPFL